LDHFEPLDIQELFNDMMKNAAKDTFSFMKSTMFEEVMGFRADEQEFIARQEQKWYRAFVASEAMYIMTLEAAESYSEYVESLPKDEFHSKYWTYVVMQHIHGRALQEFLEIITLMKNGFADGAHARWRSMYELSIISSFIIQYGENVAKKFYEASETDDRYEWAKKVRSFQQRKNTLHLMIYKRLVILIQTFGKGNTILQIKLFTLHLKVHLADFAIWGLIP
jgi:hypothetical protein